MEGSDTPLGFVGFAFAENAGDQVKILQVDGGDGCVEPTRDTIADESYPLSRTLYIYVNKAKISRNPAIKAFVDYYLSDSGSSTPSSRRATSSSRTTRSSATRSTWDSRGSAGAHRSDRHARRASSSGRDRARCRRPVPSATPTREG